MSELTIYARAKAGRCWNGAERDVGTRIHAIRARRDPSGCWDGALCGTRPGPRGNGWSGMNYAPTLISCPRCLSKLAKEKTND